MLSDFRGADRVYIACGYTDLRREIKRIGRHRAAAVSIGTIQQYIVFVLWQKAGPD